MMPRSRVDSSAMSVSIDSVSSAARSVARPLRRWAFPKIVVTGVRSSCDTRPRNSSFTRFDFASLWGACPELHGRLVEVGDLAVGVRCIDGHANSIEEGVGLDRRGEGRPGGLLVRSGSAGLA